MTNHFIKKEQKDGNHSYSTSATKAKLGRTIQSWCGV